MCVYIYICIYIFLAIFRETPRESIFVVRESHIFFSAEGIRGSRSPETETKHNSDNNTCISMNSEESPALQRPCHEFYDSLGLYDADAIDKFDDSLTRCDSP